MYDGTTRGIKNWGLSGCTSILPRIKFGVTGQESSPQSPTISYRQTLTLLAQKHQSKIYLTETKTHLILAETHLTKVAEKMKDIASAYSCTFAILPDPAHYPIAKEHSSQPNLALSGFWEIHPKQICFKLS